MAKKAGRESSRKPLVIGYVERVSREVFSDFAAQLTALVGRQHGVYALYKGDQLYYVGLANNLRGRIKRHLSDRHTEKWDRFSLYLVREAAHI
jgi:excinuclease UvrABC nuclease subunit